MNRPFKFNVGQVVKVIGEERMWTGQLVRICRRMAIKVSCQEYLTNRYDTVQLNHDGVHICIKEDELRRHIECPDGWEPHESSI